VKFKFTVDWFYNLRMSAARTGILLLKIGIFHSDASTSDISSLILHEFFRSKSHEREIFLVSSFTSRKVFCDDLTRRKNLVDQKKSFLKIRLSTSRPLFHFFHLSVVNRNPGALVTSSARDGSRIVRIVTIGFELGTTVLTSYCDH